MVRLELNCFNSLVTVGLQNVKNIFVYLSIYFVIYELLRQIKVQVKIKHDVEFCFQHAKSSDSDHLHFVMCISIIQTK